MTLRCPDAHWRPTSLALATALAWVCAIPDTAGATPLNIEQIRGQIEHTSVAANVDGSFGSSFGNVFAIDAGVAVTLAKRSGRHFLLSAAGWKFTARARYRDGDRLASLLDPGNRTTHRAHAHIRYGYDITPWLAAEGFVQYQGDEIRLLQLRTLGGGGVRFTLAHTSHSALYLGTSYFAEWETSRGSETPFALAHRWSNYLAVRVSNDRVNFTATAYVQPRLGDFSDLRLILDAALAVKLGEKISFVTKLDLNVDSKPPTYCEYSGRQTHTCPPQDLIEVVPLDLAFSQAVRLSF